SRAAGWWPGRDRRPGRMRAQRVRGAPPRGGRRARGRLRRRRPRGAGAGPLQRPRPQPHRHHPGRAGTGPRRGGRRRGQGLRPPDRPQPASGCPPADGGAGRAAVRPLGRGDQARRGRRSRPGLRRPGRAGPPGERRRGGGAGRRIAAEAGVPVYLYGAAACRPERAALPAVRGRGFEALRDALGSPGGTGSPGDPPGGPPGPRGWATDLGGPGLPPSAGATAVGARELLVAYNVDLAGADLDLARRIAAAGRGRAGGLPPGRALGVPPGGGGGRGGRRGGPPESRGLVQVSMNLLDYRVTPPTVAFAAVAELAGRAGGRVEAPEVVGLVPAAALAGVAPADLRLRGDVSELLLENRLARAMDSQLEGRR